MTSSRRRTLDIERADRPNARVHPPGLLDERGDLVPVGPELGQPVRGEDLAITNLRDAPSDKVELLLERVAAQVFRKIASGCAAFTTSNSISTSAMYLVGMLAAMRAPRMPSILRASRPVDSSNAASL